MHRDRGLTLTELIVTVAIMGVVVTALSGSIVVFLRNEGAVSERIDESRGLQQLANYLPADVASASRIETDPTRIIGTCGTGSGGTPVLELDWSESFQAFSFNATVVYRDVTTPSGRELVRAVCGSDGTSVTRLASGYSDVTVRDEDIGIGSISVALEYAGSFKSIGAQSRTILPPLGSG